MHGKTGIACVQRLPPLRKIVFRGGGVCTRAKLEEKSSSRRTLTSQWFQTTQNSADMEIIFFFPLWNFEFYVSFTRFGVEGGGGGGIGGIL